MSNSAVRLGLRLMIFSLAASYILMRVRSIAGMETFSEHFYAAQTILLITAWDSGAYNGRRIYLCSPKVQGHMRHYSEACGGGTFGGNSAPCRMGSDKVRRSLCLQYNIFLKMQTGRYILLYRPVLIYSLSLFSLSSGLSTVIFSLIILFSSASRTFSVKMPSFTSSPACGIRPKSSSAQPPRV